MQNGSPFTYFNEHPVAIAEHAALDSGELAGAVLRRATPLAIALLGMRALSPGARVVGRRQVAGFEGVRELTISSTDARALPLQVDGDYLGEVREARYSIRPGALSVVA